MVDLHEMHEKVANVFDELPEEKRNFVSGIMRYLGDARECSVKIRDIRELESGGRSSDDSFYEVVFQSCVGDSYSDSCRAEDEFEARENLTKNLAKSLENIFRQLNPLVNVESDEDRIRCYKFQQAQIRGSEESWVQGNLFS